MEQEYDEQQPHHWAQAPQQMRPRHVLQEQQDVHGDTGEQQHVQEQQLGQVGFLQSKPQAVAQPPIYLSEALKRARRPGYTAEHERQRHTPSRTDPLLDPATERWRTPTHAGVPQRALTLAPEQLQQGYQWYGNVHRWGVDCTVPHISSASAVYPQQQQQRAELLLPAVAASTTSLPVVPALLERQPNVDITEIEDDRVAREEEDDQNYSHNMRGSSSNSNCQPMGDVRRGAGEWESEEGAVTYWPHDAAERLLVTENVFGLHAPGGAFADAAGRSRSLAAAQRSSTITTAAAPSDQWDCTLRNEVATSGDPDSAALPFVSSPFYRNVLSAEATSDSGGSITSPTTSPATAVSPGAASPAPPASPVAVLSARHSPLSSSSCAGPAVGFSHTFPLPPVLVPESSTRWTPPPHTGEEEFCSTSSAGHRFYNKPGIRTRGRTAFQQARSQQDGHEGKKPRSSSTGGSGSNNSIGDFFFSTNSPPQPRDSASTPHPFPVTVCSPSAATTSALRPLPPAPPSPPSLSTSAAARTSTATCGSEDVGRMGGVSSLVVLTPAARADEESFTVSGLRRSSWGRQLEGRENPVQVIVENCIYRREKVKQPDRRPVPLPDGEALSHPQLLCSLKSQQQEESLSSRAPPLGNWRGPLALPYNAEEAPPSPFSRARRCSIWDEDRKPPHATHKRGPVTSALAAMHMPAHFLPLPYLSSEHLRRTCDGALDHADFSPPSPFFPSLSRSSTKDACGATIQQTSPYAQFSALTCAVHKQPHTFVYPFEVAETTAIPSPSASLFQTWPHTAATEAQQPVLTYYISNNGMGETVPYSSRAAAADKEKRPRTSWLCCLWPWGGRKSKTQQQRGPRSLGMQVAAAVPPRSGSTASTTFALSSSPTTRTMSPPCSEGGRSAGSSRRRGDTGSALFSASDRSPAGTTLSRESFLAAARLPPAPERGGSSFSRKGEGKTKSRRGGGGRGTFVLAAVSAALEIGCVWRFPSYCFRFGGATFLLAYVVLLLILGVPILALEMALGQVFRGGQMKVLNLISPRLRGLAAATLLLSFFICAYYSIFVSWTLQFLFFSFRPSLPWSVTSQEAAICAAAGHDSAACTRATLPMPLLSTDRLLQQQRSAQTREEDYHRQQHLLEQNPRRLSAKQQTGKQKITQQKEDTEQSFCAWRKALYSSAQGACVADDKLKARMFLYTDVLGLWEKNTHHPSTTRGLIPPAAASPPPPVSPLKGRAETTSPSFTEGERHETEVQSAASKMEPTGAAAGLAGGGTASRLGKTAAAAGEEKSSSLKSTDPPAFLRFRRLASSSAAANVGFEAGLSPRFTSVTRTTSVWSLTPLIAAGLAAVWMQIYLHSLRGYKPMTTCTYITALIPIGAMLVIAGLALSLDGAPLGVQHLFSPPPSAFSVLSSSTDATLGAPARRLRVKLTADQMSRTSILSASALPRRAAATRSRDAGEEASPTPDTSGEQVGDKGSTGLAAANAAAEDPFLKAGATSARHEGSRSKRRKSSDMISSVLSLWPRWLAAGSHTLWGEAAAQVFFSLGVFQGVVTAYASHKRLTENVLVDAAAAAVTNVGMSLLAAVATFAVAGHVAKGLGAVGTGAHAADLSALQDIQGSQLVFVLYPLAFASLPTGLAQLACILCFLALLLLGLMSVVGLMQPLMGLLRRCSQIEKCPRWKIVAVVCATGFVTGIPFCTRGGLLLLEAADYHWTVVGLTFIGCCESIAFGWMYAVGRQAHSIGYLPVLLHAVTYWMAVLIAAGLLFLSPPPYNTVTTALAVSLSVAAAGAAAALWFCPWKRTRSNDSQLQQQQQQQKKQDGLPMPKQEHPPQDQPTQQQLAKRKGKAQTGTTEKGRVTFTNGFAGNGNSCPTASVDNSSSMRIDVHEGQPLHRETTPASNSNVIHLADSSDRSASSEGAALGNQARNSSSGGSTESICSTKNSRGGPACSQRSGDNSRDACAVSNTVNPSAPTENSDSSSSSATAESSNTVPRGSRTETLRTLSTGVSSGVTGEGRVPLREGQGRNQRVSSNSAAVGNSSDSSNASGPNSSSSSNGSGMNEGSRDAVHVQDTKEAAETFEQQQQQKRYRSPRGRSSRRKRGKHSFVLIKRNGEALSFTACVFWLFVGNVEHLRKNLNAITCSGYHVLRLWPPWSIVIRYVIPTILLLLVVQELPQLFFSVSRYSKTPSAAAAVASSRSIAVAWTGQHQPQHLHATQQQHPPLQQLPSEEHQQTSRQRQIEQEMLQRSATLPGTSVSWQSLVVIHVFTLGALFLLVGLIVLGLVLPHVWEVFIPKERRKSVSEAAPAAVSSRSLFAKSSTEATTLTSSTKRQQP